MSSSPALPRDLTLVGREQRVKEVRGAFDARRVGCMLRDESLEFLVDEQFLDAVAVAMITPGPVVITVALDRARRAIVMKMRDWATFLNG